MRAADLVQKTHNVISPPYKTIDIFTVIGAIIIFLAIPFTVITLNQRLGFTASADVDGLVSKINAYRNSKGLASLAQDQKLVNAACWMAGDMAGKNYFSHTDSLGRNFSTRLTDFGVGASFWRAETLAAGASTGQAVLDLWKNSPGHNAILLDPNPRRIGVGVAYNVNSNYGWYWVADFASGSATSVTNQCQLSSTGQIQGYKVVMPGNKNQNPAASQTVRLDNGSPTSANPYYFRNVKSGNHIVSVTVPAGYKVGYTLCYNSSSCHSRTPTYDSLVTVSVPVNGFADLWWHYTDITSPTVSITSPTNGETVAGTVNISASASDNDKVSNVKFYIDSVLKVTDSTAPFSYSWNTRALGDTGHTIYAVATDLTGNNKTSVAISVKVKQDIDGDGFDFTVEEYVGTDPRKACALTSAANDELDDKWPADFDDNQVINIADITQLTPPVFGSSEGDPNYSRRKDLNADGVINITDIDKLKTPVFGSTCKP